MKNNYIKYLLLIFFSFSFANFSQNSFSDIDEYYKAGLLALENGNEKSAITHFKKSANIYSRPESNYELAKIYFNRNTVKSRTVARECLQKAIWKEPNNIEYKLLMAKLMQKFSDNLAGDVYEEILKIDPKNVDALYNLGLIREKYFYEFNRSVSKYDGEPSLSYDAFAIEDFIKAERYFNTAIKNDSSQTDAYLHLASLYEEAELSEKGIDILENLVKRDSTSKEALLYLGLLCYKISKVELSHDCYKRAIGLMTESEAEEFKYKSAELLLSNEFEPDFYSDAENNIYDVLSKYWDSADPLFLTDYNERLLEHYSRVAYSNLRFSVPELNIKGWDSDRGEILVRYGEPLQRIRYRPHINSGGRTQLMLKTDLWIYPNKILAFTDEFFNDNYRFSTPAPGGRHHSQFAGDTDFFVQELRRIDPQTYIPKFDGPRINVPYNIAQFKDLDNENNSATRLIVNYAFDNLNQFEIGRTSIMEHKYGLFFINSQSEIEKRNINSVKQFDNKSKIKIGLNNEIVVNTATIELEPDSGMVAFEIIRNKDDAVFTDHFNFKVRDFSNNNLELSDIILASDISQNNNFSAVLKRGEFNILPNPLQEFNSTTDLYIYYEVYNLKLDEDGLTNFAQDITITPVDENSGIGKFFNSVFSIFGSGNETITLSSDYQSQKKNAQIYLQLDMKNYKPGNYIINIEVTDNNNNESQTSQTLLEWSN